MAFNWLATNVPAGTIVNFSTNYFRRGCETSFINTALENAIKAAHNAGIIVVVCAGNDACNTADYSLTRIPESFVVGATSNAGLPGTDRKASFSRTGENISAFAPGEEVQLMGYFGKKDTSSGTSFSAPYIAGIFAVACEATGSYCRTTPTAKLYQALRDTGTLGTVTKTNGNPFIFGTTSRFISQQW